MPGAGEFRALEVALAETGLCPRGWLFPQKDTAPGLASGDAVSAICLVGHVGGGYWRVFEAWRKNHSGIRDPLDAWSKAVITPLATAAGGEAVFPSDTPWHPFQTWAMAAEGLKPSPLGMLIHPGYGLWHGYRGAILFGGPAVARLGLPAPVESGDGRAAAPVHPCDGCVDRPCLSACPVGAFSPDGFEVGACRAYLKTDAGQQGCMRAGCAARDACPVGRQHRYGGAQIRFHMAAFQ